MSRILIPCLDFPPTRGGIQSYLVEIFGRLASRHEIRVLAPTTGDDETGAAVVDLEVHRPSATWRRWIPGRSLADVTGLTGLIATECKSWRPDILICGHPRLAPSCAIAGRLFRRPVTGLDRIDSGERAGPARSTVRRWSLEAIEDRQEVWLNRGLSRVHPGSHRASWPTQAATAGERVRPSIERSRPLPS